MAGVLLKTNPPIGVLALRAVALLFLPLQKFAEQRLTLLLRKIRGCRAFILQVGGKIAASAKVRESVRRGLHPRSTRRRAAAGSPGITKRKRIRSRRAGWDC